MSSPEQTQEIESVPAITEIEVKTIESLPIKNPTPKNLEPIPSINIKNLGIIRKANY